VRTTEYFGFPEDFGSPAIKSFREAAIIHGTRENHP
jgi:hypothetical protein